MSAERPTRVILGATCYKDAKSALTLAIQVALKTGREVSGLLIEEETILQFANMPAARTIDRAGRPVSDVGAERMMKAFRQDAAHFEHSLREAATARALRWSFSRKRGRLVPVLSEIAGSGDLVLLGGEPVERTPGEVVLLLSDDGDTELFGLAAHLAQTHRCRLRVMVRSTKRPLQAEVPATAIFENVPDEGVLRARLAAVAASNILVADVSDLTAQLGPVLEHARFPRLLRGVRGLRA